jgi:hypothetical protein
MQVDEGEWINKIIYLILYLKSSLKRINLIIKIFVLGCSNGKII